MPVEAHKKILIARLRARCPENYRSFVRRRRRQERLRRQKACRSVNRYIDAGRDSLVPSTYLLNSLVPVTTFKAPYDIIFCSQYHFMLEFFLLVLLLVFVFRFFASALRQQGTAPAMGDQGNVIVIHSVKEWEEKLEEANKAHKTVVVDFTATWCGPCKTMAPIFLELSKKYPSLMFLKVDVDQVQEVAGAWDVNAMPTFIFIKDKKLVHKIVGANRDELDKKTLFFSSTSS